MAKKKKEKKEIREHYSYRARPSIVSKAAAKCEKEERKSISSKIEDLLYDYITR